MLILRQQRWSWVMSPRAVSKFSRRRSSCEGTLPRRTVHAPNLPFTTKPRMRFLIFILGALACVGIPLLFYTLGSPPSTYPPPMEETEGNAVEPENPGGEVDER